MSLPKGFKHSPETLAKMSASTVRRDIKFGPEYRARIAETLRGHEVKPETRKKISEKLQGENNKNWKGGKFIGRDGYCYLLCRDHPFANPGGYVREHRLVMEAHLGRTLLRTEIVHHINGNRLDNRIENLMLFSSNGQHQSHHHAMRRKQF